MTNKQKFTELYYKTFNGCKECGGAVVFEAPLTLPPEQWSQELQDKIMGLL